MSYQKHIVIKIYFVYLTFYKIAKDKWRENQIKIELKITMKSSNAILNRQPKHSYENNADYEKNAPCISLSLKSQKTKFSLGQKVS